MTMLLAIGLLGASNVMAQAISEVCDELIGAAGTRAYITAETDASGQIILTISPFDPIGNPEGITVGTYTSFRGGGWNDARFQAALMVNNNDGAGFQANTGFKFFTRDVPGAMPHANNAGPTKTQMIIAPVPGMVQEGAIIRWPAGGNNLEWTTPGNGNIFVGVALPDYTYGTNCTGTVYSKLTPPQNVVVTGNTITFDPVADAESYVATVILGGIVIKTQTVANGGTLTAPLNGNATVYLQAVDNDGILAISDMSDAASWTISNGDAAVGGSTFCEKAITPTGRGVLVVSIATALDGDLEVTIHDDTWRGGGVKAAAWIVEGISGVFEKIDAECTNTLQVFRPKAGFSIPKGAVISYNATMGSLEWTGAEGYINVGTPFTGYVYGSACTAPQLDPPANLTLTGNVLTFTPDVRAARTEVQVTSGATVLLTIADFTSTDVINFPINGNFTIRARSITPSADYATSDWTATIPLVVNLSDAAPGLSAYCNWEVNPTGAGSAGTDGTGVGYATDNVNDDTVQFTWETDAEGKILVTIIGVPGVAHNGTTTQFRGATPLNKNNLRIGGVPAANLVTESNTATVYTYTPVAGISIPKGTTITYNGTVAYQAVGTSDATGLDNLWPTIAFSYKYGATCATIIDTDGDGIMTKTIVLSKQVLQATMVVR